MSNCSRDQTLLAQLGEPVQVSLSPSNEEEGVYSPDGLWSGSEFSSPNADVEWSQLGILPDIQLVDPMMCEDHPPDNPVSPLSSSSPQDTEPDDSEESAEPSTRFDSAEYLESSDDQRPAKRKRHDSQKNVMCAWEAFEVQPRTSIYDQLGNNM